MTKEALKLALEALEASHLLIHGSETKGGVRDYIDGYYSGCFDFVSNKNQINEAITAIKEALAKPNFCPRCGKRLSTNDWDIHTCTPLQRTWVGLTKEERHEISMANRPYCADVMAAHEEELKRRNT